MVQNYCGRDVYKMMYTITNTSSDRKQRRVVVMNSSSYMCMTVLELHRSFSNMGQAWANNVCTASINCTEQCFPIDSYAPFNWQPQHVKPMSQFVCSLTYVAPTYTWLKCSETIKQVRETSAASKGNFCYKYEQNRSPVTAIVNTSILIW